MAAKIQKWGNSLAIRVPKTYSDALGLTEGTDIKIKIVKDKLIVSRKKKQEIKLSELLSKITDKNLHKEISFTKPAIKEAGL
jgi:antitoxin MazE